MWGWRVRLQSNIMPRFRAVRDSEMVSSPMVNEEVGGCLPCLECIKRNSVIPSFSLRSFRGIHCQTSVMYRQGLWDHLICHRLGKFENRQRRDGTSSYKLWWCPPRVVCRLWTRSDLTQNPEGHHKRGLLGVIGLHWWWHTGISWKGRTWTKWGLCL